MRITTYIWDKLYKVKVSYLGITVRYSSCDLSEAIGVCVAEVLYKIVHREPVST